MVLLQYTKNNNNDSRDIFDKQAKLKALGQTKNI